MYNNHYFIMQEYGFGSHGILVILAHLLMFISFAGFILSMAMYFIKKGSIPANIDTHQRACSHCGFKMRSEWQCCPRCGNEGNKQETSAAKTNIVEFVTPIEETQASEPEISDVATTPAEELQEIEQVNSEVVMAPVIDIQESVQTCSVEIVTPVNEIQREEQEYVEPVEAIELNDVVERIYQDGKEKSTGNGKNTKKKGKPNKNQKAK